MFVTVLIASLVLFYVASVSGHCVYTPSNPSVGYCDNKTPQLGPNNGVFTLQGCADFCATGGKNLWMNFVSNGQCFCSATCSGGDNNPNVNRYSLTSPAISICPAATNKYYCNNDQLQVTTTQYPTGKFPDGLSCATACYNKNAGYGYANFVTSGNGNCLCANACSATAAGQSRQIWTINNACPAAPAHVASLRTESA